jgi:hypothetical protein
MGIPESSEQQTHWQGDLFDPVEGNTRRWKESDPILQTS